MIISAFLSFLSIGIGTIFVAVFLDMNTNISGVPAYVIGFVVAVVVVGIASAILDSISERLRR